ncbi:MAG TPA: GNAT family N-acetyltransferase [Streptosporangiaceae bacterium]|jgi:predicted acetyltransferase
MATSYPIRLLTEDDLPGFQLVHQHAFHGGEPSEQSRARMLARFEFDRNLAAFDGPTQVGVAGIFSFRMRVPGALIPVAGVTMIAVLPSHRRRGILTALMRQQLRDIHERGEAVAALFASEAGIYRRYGYGQASQQACFRLRGGEARLAADAPAREGLRLRLADPGSVRPELAKVYDLVLAERPGLYGRNYAWWDKVLTDDISPGTPLRCVLIEDDAGPLGYALFTGTPKWDGPTFLADSSLDIREVMVCDPAAAAALWGDLLTRDLTTEFTAEMRPVDDLLLHLLADPRRLRTQISDGLWVRLVDVGRALAQRRYAAPVDAVIEIPGDDLCPHNACRWRLTTQQAAPPAGSPATGSAATGVPAFPVGGLAASCERTSAPADVTLPVHALGSAYLGGVPLGSLARAGLVSEARPGAVAALSTALSWDPAPWCPYIF